MAISAAIKTADFSGFIKPEEARGVFDEAARYSAAQQMFRKVELGASGTEFPIITSKPSANWVGEGAKKPTTEAKLGLVKMQPKKLAAIAVVSAEVVRANPGGYSDILKSEIAQAFAVAFDLAAFHNKGGDGSGSGPFEHYIGETSKTTALSAGVYDGIVTGMGLNLKGNPKKGVTGFIFDTSVETDFLGAKDNDGRPLFVDAQYTDGAAPTARGRLLGRPALIAPGVENETTVGFLGDMSKAVWGVVGGGISFDVTTQAAVTIGGQLTSLWENNLVAIRAEAEYGFAVADTSAFVKVTRS